MTNQVYANEGSQAKDTKISIFFSSFLSYPPRRFKDKERKTGGKEGDFVILGFYGSLMSTRKEREEEGNGLCYLIFFHFLLPARRAPFLLFTCSWRA